MEGVTLSHQKRIFNEKGDILHGIKKSDKQFKDFGEAYFSLINFGEIKGWKKHTISTLNLLVPSGDVRFVIYDDREDSESFKLFQEVIIGEKNYARLTVEPNLWVAFQGHSSNSNLILNISDLEHNMDKFENCSIDAFKFKW